MKFIGNENITKNIFRTQAYDSIMRGYFLLDILSLSCKVKVCWSITIYFLLENLKRMIE